MSTRNRFSGVLTAVAAALLAATPAVSGHAAQEGQFAIITALNSPLEEMSIHDLRRLFMGEMINGPGGRRLIPLTQPPNSPDRIAFDRSVMGLSPDQVAQYWVDQRIRGQAGAPKSIDSTDLLQRVIVRIEGGVGYVRAHQVNKEVKVIRIDGRTPGEPGYRVTL